MVVKPEHGDGSHAKVAHLSLSVESVGLRLLLMWPWAQFGGGRGGDMSPPPHFFNQGGHTIFYPPPPHFADDALLFHSSNYKLNQQPDFLFFGD